MSDFDLLGYCGVAIPDPPKPAPVAKVSDVPRGFKILAPRTKLLPPGVESGYAKKKLSEDLGPSERKEKKVKSARNMFTTPPNSMKKAGSTGSGGSDNAQKQLMFDEPTSTNLDAGTVAAKEGADFPEDTKNTESDTWDPEYATQNRLVSVYGYNLQYNKYAIQRNACRKTAAQAAADAQAQEQLRLNQEAMDLMREEAFKRQQQARDEMRMACEEQMQHKAAQRAKEAEDEKRWAHIRDLVNANAPSQEEVMRMQVESKRSYAQELLRQIHDKDHRREATARSEEAIANAIQMAADAAAHEMAIARQTEADRQTDYRKQLVSQIQQNQERQKQLRQQHLQMEKEQLDRLKRMMHQEEQARAAWNAEQKAIFRKEMQRTLDRLESKQRQRQEEFRQAELIRQQQQEQLAQDRAREEALRISRKRDLVEGLQDQIHHKQSALDREREREKRWAEIWAKHRQEKLWRCKITKKMYPPTMFVEEYAPKDDTCCRSSA